MNTEYDIPMVEEKYLKLIYKMDSQLDAPVESVWQAISNPKNLLRWDTMLLEIKGEIKKGSKFKLRSKINPSQSFSLKVPKYSPPNLMVWKSGIAPLFKGVRTYRLEQLKGLTVLRMEEVYSGVMLPLMKKELPDCETIFGTFIRDLKHELDQ